MPFSFASARLNALQAAVRHPHRHLHTNRTRFSVGGDRINYPGEDNTPTADMLVAKMLFNSVISTKEARFMTMDISNFYLMTPLHRPEFIRIKLSDIPDEVINEYKLNEKATKNGSIYIRAKRTAYRKQA